MIKLRAMLDILKKGWPSDNKIRGFTFFKGRCEYTATVFDYSLVFSYGLNSVVRENDLVINSSQDVLVESFPECGSKLLELLESQSYPLQRLFTLEIVAFLSDKVDVYWYCKMGFFFVFRSFVSTTSTMMSTRIEEKDMNEWIAIYKIPDKKQQILAIVDKLQIPDLDPELFSQLLSPTLSSCKNLLPSKKDFPDFFSHVFERIIVSYLREKKFTVAEAIHLYEIFFDVWLEDGECDETEYFNCVLQFALHHVSNGFDLLLRDAKNEEFYSKLEAVFSARDCAARTTVSFSALRFWMAIFLHIDKLGAQTGNICKVFPRLFQQYKSLSFVCWSEAANSIKGDFVREDCAFPTSLTAFLDWNLKERCAFFYSTHRDFVLFSHNKNKKASLPDNLGLRLRFVLKYLARRPDELSDPCEKAMLLFLPFYTKSFVRLDALEIVYDAIRQFDMSYTLGYYISKAVENSIHDDAVNDDRDMAYNTQNWVSVLIQQGNGCAASHSRIWNFLLFAPGRAEQEWLECFGTISKEIVLYYTKKYGDCDAGRMFSVLFEEEGWAIQPCIFAVLHTYGVEFKRWFESWKKWSKMPSAIIHQVYLNGRVLTPFVFLFFLPLPVEKALSILQHLGFCSSEIFRAMLELFSMLAKTLFVSSKTLDRTEYANFLFHMETWIQCATQTQTRICFKPGMRVVLSAVVAHSASVNATVAHPASVNTPEANEGGEDFYYENTMTQEYVLNLLEKIYTSSLIEEYAYWTSCKLVGDSHEDIPLIWELVVKNYPLLRAWKTRTFFHPSRHQAECVCVDNRVTFLVAYEVSCLLGLQSLDENVFAYLEGVVKNNEGYRITGRIARLYDYISCLQAVFAILEEEAMPKAATATASTSTTSPSPPLPILVLRNIVFRALLVEFKDAAAKF